MFLQSARIKFLLLISFVFAIEVMSGDSLCYEPPIESILNVSVWDGLNPLIRAEYNRLKAETEKISDSNEYKVATTVVGVIPGFGELVQLGKLLVECSISIADDIIPRVIEMEVVKHKYSEYKATLQVMDNNLNRLMQPDLESMSRISMTHDIQNEFEKLLILLADRNGAREYDRFSAPIVLTLAQLAAIFEQMTSEFMPKHARSSRIACQLKDILREYRSYVIYDKIRTDISSKFFHRDYPSAIAYGHAPICSQNITALRHLSVPMGNIEINTNGDNGKAKVADFYRMKIEETFLPYIKKTDQLCSASPSNQFKTGEGKLTLIVNSYNFFKLKDDSDCDFEWSTDSERHGCDVFFEIYINDTKVHTTATLDNTAQAVVFYKFISSKIRKDSVIRIKVMDKDGHLLNGGDDPIAEWTTNIDQLLIDGYHQIGPAYDYQYVDISAFWEDKINLF